MVDRLGEKIEEKIPKEGNTRVSGEEIGNIDPTRGHTVGIDRDLIRQEDLNQGGERDTHHQFRQEAHVRVVRQRGQMEEDMNDPGHRGEPARRFHHRPRRSQRAPVDQPAYWLKISVPLVPPKPKELLMA